MFEPPSPDMSPEEQGGGEAGLQQSLQEQAGDGAMPEASSDANGKAPPVGAQSFFLQGNARATPTGEKNPQESGPMSRQT